MKSINYNFIAPYYDLLAKLVFYGKIQEAQLAQLSFLPESGHVLFIGGGSGFALNSIAKLRPNLKIDYIDSSSKMIQMSRNSLKSNKLNNVRFIKGELLSIPRRSYDCIISNFFLDLFDTSAIHNIFNKLNSLLKNEGLWFVADFNLPLGFKQKSIERSMYSFLRIMTRMENKRIPDIKSLFPLNIYTSVQSKDFYSKFIFSTVYKKKLE